MFNTTEIQEHIKETTATEKMDYYRMLPTNKGGRPRKYKSNAERQKAYRQRKTLQNPFTRMEPANGQ